MTFRQKIISKWGQKIISRLKLIFFPCPENNYRPKILAGKFLFYYVIFLLFLKLIVLAFLIYFPKTLFFAEISRSTLISLVNQERQSFGLNLLKENPQLNEAAFQKGQDMIAQDYFSHLSPTGQTPWYWFKKAGYEYKLAGENLAIGFLDSEEVHRAWKESPSHRANFLNEGYQEIGIAVLTGDFQGNETTIVVQLFGKPAAKGVKEIVRAQEKPQTQAPFEEETELQEPLSEKEVKAGEIPEKEIIFEEPESHIFEKEAENRFGFGFLKFMAFGYNSLVQKIIYYSLILVIISLILNIFVKFRIQHKDLILKTLFFIVLLAAFVFLDKELIIQLIPHHLIIP